MFYILPYFANERCLISIAGIKAAIKLLIEYGISKAALDMVTKQFFLELGQHPIRVNSVSPTCLLTDFVKDQIEKAPEMAQKFNSVTPLGRL